MSKRSDRRLAAPNILAVRQAPAANPMTALAEAQQHLMSGRHALAVAALKPALADAMHRPEALYLLAVAALMQKQFADAVTHAREAVVARPSEARYHFTLGRAMKAAEDRVAAAAAYRRALDLRPSYVEAMVSLGIVLKDQGELDEAIALYEKALRIDASLSAAHANRAHALALRAERMAEEGYDKEPDEEMLDAQGRAVALDLKNPQLHKNYGVLLLQARRHQEAVVAFNEALTLDPSDVECCLRLGDALQDLGAVGLECEAYRTWLTRNPPNGAVMRALSGGLTRLGEADDALAWAEKSYALDPDPVTVLQMANVLQQLRRVGEALQRSREALDAAGRHVSMYPNFALGSNYLYEEPGPIFDLHAEFGRQLPVSSTPRPAWRAKGAGERLKIGYVSGDFLRHSVAYFAQSLLACHDTRRFEVVCYQNNAHTDDVTARLKSHGHRWTECAGLSDNALRSRIVADGIDILIDLSGHTAHSRLMMMATPCAPVQIAYLGYPTVTGVPAMDFRITDEVIDAGDMPMFDSELALRLPRTMFCFTPDEVAPDVATTPALDRGFVTFGSFNNIAKVSDHTLELWSATLRAVPGSRLLLKASSMDQSSNCAGIEAFMAARGIAPDRLTLLARTPQTDSHLSLYNQVDISLDTYPYTGATTTCEALWMGTPVVTLKGRTHTSRMGASILTAIGRAAWVAENDTAYVDIASALAANPVALNAWRSTAREHLQASPLLDRQGFTRQFEEVLEHAWRERGSAITVR